MDIVELYVGIAQIAIALAGFTGVVVAFGSRSEGAWHPGDRLRLSFLLEASLTAAGFSLLALLVVAVFGDTGFSWVLLSICWALFTISSLWFSHRQIRDDVGAHDDVDKLANRLTTLSFVTLIALQLVNVLLWQHYSVFLAAVILNLAGAAMQFARLIRSAFRV